MNKQAERSYHIPRKQNAKWKCNIYGADKNLSNEDLRKQNFPRSVMKIFKSR